jgi:2'-5' RNA ligase
MLGLVSLLDDAHSIKVRILWDAWERLFGIRHLLEVTPVPHISYFIAPEIDVEKLERQLGKFVMDMKPFKVMATGIGIFTHPRLVLYTPVVRTQTLTEVHSRLMAHFMPAASNPLALYMPDQWMPHITLAYEDVTPELLPEIFNWLHRHPISWEIEIDNVALLGNTDTRLAEPRRLKFGDKLPLPSP